MSFFMTPFGLFHVQLLPAFFWNMIFMMYFLDVARSTKVFPLSYINSSSNVPVAFSVRFVLFHIYSLKCPITIVMRLNMYCVGVALGHVSRYVATDWGQDKIMIF